MPLTVSVPEEDAEAEPHELGERVPDLEEQPVLVPDTVLEEETDALCETLCVPLIVSDEEVVVVNVGLVVTDDERLVLRDTVKEAVEQIVGDAVPDADAEREVDTVPVKDPDVLGVEDVV